MAGTETKRIIELTEASTVQSGDFIAVDSNARGTKKVSTDALATSAALTAETTARTGADEQMSERMDGIEEQTALIQNPTKTLSGALVSFTDGANMPMVACTASIVPKQSGSGTPSPSNVRPISGWESVNVYVSPTEDEADGHTTTTSLGRTVYGGTLDVVSGVLTVDRAMITIDGTNYNMAMSGGRKRCYISDLSVPKAKPSPDAHTPAPNLIANYLTAVGDAEAYSGAVGVCVYTTAAANIGFTLTGNTMTLDEVKAYLAQNPLQVCYELATPQTYTLTPTEVNTLLGENNVWADSGDVEITYRRDISIVINNLESALNG